MSAPAVVAAPILGREEPRLWTRPLRRLTKNATLGHECIAFAEQILGATLLPWQKWWLLHALELKRDGTFRYRTILTLVARQQGKTTLIKIVCLWAMYLGRAELVLGAAQSLDIAKEAWDGATQLAQDNPELSPEIAAVRRTNGENTLTLSSGARYRITAATGKAGRGLSVDVLVLDELREHQSFAAWAALSKTTMARPNALILCISNAGDDDSVVLNQLRSAALAEADESLGLFEWSAPDGCDLHDPAAWAQAMPALGHGPFTVAAVRSALATDPPATFRTELLCQRVTVLDAAVDVAGWKAGADPTGTLARQRRSRIAVAVEAAPDGGHVALVGAAVLPDGRVRVAVAKAWPTTDQARRELGPLLKQMRPAAVAWFPAGPTAALGAELRGFKAAAITGQAVNEACMSFADLVLNHRILHPDDPLLNTHISNAQRLLVGDGWRFARRGVGEINTAYAAAGAVHAARTMPAPVGKPRLIIARDPARNTR